MGSIRFHVAARIFEAHKPLINCSLVRIILFFFLPFMLAQLGHMERPFEPLLYDYHTSKWVPLGRLSKLRHSCKCTFIGFNILFFFLLNSSEEKKNVLIY